MKVPRDVNAANVKFIRIGGDAPPAAPAAGAVAPEGAGAPSGAASPTPPPRRPTLGGGGDKYPGDHASKAQLAAWLGRQAEKRGLPKQLPVMASLVESGVKNLNYGDADSVGFFQMRVGIWNKGEYAGFPEKPELQAKWFLDQAEAVKKQRIARGQSVTDPKQFGDWIADIERPAAQYRSRYGMRLGEANALLAKAGDSAPAAAPAPPPPSRSRPRRRAARPPPARPRTSPRARPEAEAEPARRRWRRSRRRRSTRARRTSGAARPRRPASTAQASCSGPTPRRGSRSRASPTRSSPRATGPRSTRSTSSPATSCSSARPATSTTSGSRWAGTSSSTRPRPATS